MRNENAYYNYLQCNLIRNSFRYGTCKSGHYSTIMEMEQAEQEDETASGSVAIEGVNSTIIQRVHEQSIAGIYIFPVFYLLSMDHLCTNR